MPTAAWVLTLTGLGAATGMLITAHPQMLDVASMSQFLLMTEALLSELKKDGAVLKYDLMRYLLTRFEAQDGPQTKVAALLRHLFGDPVLTNAIRILRVLPGHNDGLTNSPKVDAPRSPHMRADRLAHDRSPCLDINDGPAARRAFLRLSSSLRRRPARSGPFAPPDRDAPKGWAAAVRLADRDVGMFLSGSLPAPIVGRIADRVSGGLLGGRRREALRGAREGLS